MLVNIADGKVLVVTPGRRGDTSLAAIGHI
jgi:hypothetical protein